MSTILDALKKLQREKAAQSPSRDLRGSVATETPWPPPRRARRRGRAWLAVALLALVGGAGYWAYASGRLSSLIARTSADGEAIPSEAELDALEAETRAAEAAAGTAQPPTPAPPPDVVSPPPRAVAAPPTPPVSESPEMTAERARLEATIAKAREAQAAQQRAEAAAAAAAAAPPPAAAPAPTPQATAAAPVAPAPEAAQAPSPTPSTPAPPQAAAKTAPAAPPKPPAKAIAKSVAKPAEKPVAAPRPRPAPRAEESVLAGVSFPAVTVERIRWHPIPERRVVSLRFEQQNEPEAHEGDIVAGVLVYRIDPGAVELRIGSEQRIVRPGS